MGDGIRLSDLRPVIEYRQKVHDGTLLTVATAFQLSDAGDDVELLEEFVRDNLGRTLSTFIFISNVEEVGESALIQVESFPSLVGWIMYGTPAVQISDVEVIEAVVDAESGLQRVLLRFRSKGSTVSGVLVVYFWQPFGDGWVPMLCAIPSRHDSSKSHADTPWTIVFDYMPRGSGTVGDANGALLKAIRRDFDRDWCDRLNADASVTGE